LQNSNSINKGGYENEHQIESRPYRRRVRYFSNAVGCLSTKFIESAQGAILRDVEGREYIDFAGGIGAMNVGHSHPKVVAAIKYQAEKMTHTCLMINPYPPAVELAEKLCKITPGDFEKKLF